MSAVPWYYVELLWATCLLLGTVLFVLIRYMYGEGFDEALTQQAQEYGQDRRPRRRA